jgi:peptidoglycan/LPS O-acetylase OafA/YrhL
VPGRYDPVVALTTEARRPTKFAYVPALDGLRGILVLTISVFHYSITAGWEPTRAYLTGSFFAPSAFFTLSGYLITSLLLAERERSGGIDGRSFWARRFRRLLPSSVATVLAIVALTAVWPDLWGQVTGSDIAATLTSTYNWQAIRIADAGQPLRLLGPLSTYWSLSLEEQFYLLLFGVVIVASARGRDMTRWLVAMLVAVVAWSLVALALIDSTPQREYYGTDTRAAELAIGCLLAVWVHHRGMPRSPAWRWVGLASLAVACLCWALVPEQSAFVLGGGLTLFALVTAGMIVGCSVPGAMAAALAWRPLVWVGRVSYPMYLVHWPLTLAVSPSRTGLVGWPLIGLRVALACVIAGAVFRFLERPLRTASAVAWPRGLAWWVGCSALAVGAATVDSGWGWLG